MSFGESENLLPHVGDNGRVQRFAFDRTSPTQHRVLLLRQNQTRTQRQIP
jgi:hypothetical protein